MTDCSSLQGSTGSSSDAMSSRSGGGGSAVASTTSTSSSRIRVIRLTRPNSRRIHLGPESNVSFGFAVRGGKEYSTGFFVSRIEKGSEAELKGLKVGDQIIRVNGYHVDDAVHKELTQFISSQDRLTLKVRGVGMIPIKEKTLDPLTWHIVPRNLLSATLTALDDQFISKDVRVVLKVAPKTKLGLGICKGPDWKPGIFVQFTKDHSVAREAGLRPGDQILCCNSIDFSDVLFSEAVAVMKSSSILEIIIRTGAGLDLFPGESSGYNSSASSITGDQSPCWADQTSKRLSIVREESWENQKNLDRRKYLDNRQKNNNINSIYSSNTISDESNKTIIQLSENGTLINNTIIPNNANNDKSDKNNMLRSNDNHLSLATAQTNFITPDYANASLLSSTNTNNNNRNNEYQINGKIADICFVQRKSETKTVIVEVHAATDEETNNKNINNITHNSNCSSSHGITSSVALKKMSTVENNCNKINNNAPAPPKPPLIPSSSISSCGSLSLSSMMTMSSVTDSGHVRSPSATSSIISSGNTSLCSAISEELKKRRERISQGTNQINNENDKNTTISNIKQQPKRFTNPFGGDERHNAISEELQARLKLRRERIENKERQAELSKTVIMKDETDHRSPPPPPSLQQKIFNGNGMANGNGIQNGNGVHNNGINLHENENTKNFQNFVNANQNKDYVHQKTELFNNNNKLLNGQLATPPPPPEFANNPPARNNFSSFKRPSDSDVSPIPPPLPETPAPDYDITPYSTISKSLQSVNGNFRASNGNAIQSNKVNGEIAELESIESFQLANPTSPIPKPPTAYFQSQNSGPPTMKKTNRPVSVTISEYGHNGYGRKEPSKFDFITKSTENLNSSSPLSTPTTPLNGQTDVMSHMLRSELELTLSRSNLKKRTEIDRKNYLNGDNSNGDLMKNGHQNGCTLQNNHNGVNGSVLKMQNGNLYQNGNSHQNDNSYQNGKPIINRTQSSNIEKLTNMLQNKQNQYEMNNNKNGSINSSNRVTISIPNNNNNDNDKNDILRKTDGSASTTNGILKNGLNRNSYGEKSISFGN